MWNYCLTVTEIVWRNENVLEMVAMVAQLVNVITNATGLCN